METFVPKKPRNLTVTKSWPLANHLENPFFAPQVHPNDSDAGTEQNYDGSRGHDKPDVAIRQILPEPEKPLGAWTSGLEVSPQGFLQHGLVEFRVG